MDDRMGKYIEKLRKEKGLTQKELAKLLGISNTAVSKWECDCNLPDISMLGPLSKVLDADIMILLRYLNNNGKICNDSEETKDYSKLKLIFLISCIVLLVLSSIILATTIILRRKDSNNNANEVKVYEIVSQDPRIGIKGFLMFNEESRLIILEKLNYQEISRGTSGEIYTNRINLYIIIGNETVYKYETEESNKKSKLSDLLNNLDLEDAESYNTDVNLMDIDEKNNELTLKIDYLSTEGNKDTIEAKLSLKQLFI